MRSGPGGADGSGNGKRPGKARIVQPAAEIGDQFMLAAIKMRAAADVEQQAVGRIASDQRRVTQAPVGNGFEQSGIGFGIFGNDLDAGMHGAGLRQCQAGLEAKPLGCRIDSREEFDIAALAGDDKRRMFGRFFTRPDDAVGREPAQPQAEHALRG